MELLYGTGNPGKLDHMRRNTEGLGIDFISLAQLNAPPPQVKESGNSPRENAYLKASAYSRYYGRPVVAMDSGFYLEGVAEAEQPGVHVRRVGGRRLSDEEMIAHYAQLAHRHKGRLRARFCNALCLCDGDKVWQEDGEALASIWFVLVDTPCPERAEGLPLESLLINPETGRYYCLENQSLRLSRPETRAAYRAFFQAYLSSL